MAKKTNVEKAAGTEVSFLIPDTESLGMLDDMERDFSLTMKYKSADDWAAIKDKPIKCFYMGMREIPNENGEMVNCGLFVSKTECFISGQMTLIEAVKQLVPKTPVEVVYLGKKANKSSEGSTMIFDVATLK